MKICIYNEQHIYKDANYDHTINQYYGLLANTLFISTQNMDKNKNIVSIKSEINNNKTKAIVWWNFKGDNQIIYYIYDSEYIKNLYNTENISVYLYSSNIPNICVNNEYIGRINAFPYNDQIAFSYTIENGNVQILLYNKTGLIYDSYIIKVYCENNNELSKLCFNDNKNILICN